METTYANLNENKINQQKLIAIFKKMSKITKERKAIGKKDRNENKNGHRLKERVVYRNQSGKATEASVRQSAKRQLPRLASPCHRVAKRVPIIRLAAWKRDSCNPSTEPEQTSHSGRCKAEHSLFEILSINRPLIC